MKKLLFPAYADAGANATFADKDETDGDSETEMVSSADGLQSEATTAIFDNRTTTKLPQDSERRPHVEEVGAIPSDQPMDDISRKESKSGTPANANGFFPSTAPNLARPQTTRGVSTTTRSGSREVPFPSLPPRKVEETSGPDHAATTANGVVEEIDESEQTTVTPSRRLDEDSIREHAAECGTSADRLLLNAKAVSELPQQGPKDDNQFRGSDLRGSDDGRSDVVSDVLSTASEMGTVINISSRMAEVNAMALLTPIAITEEDSETEDCDEHYTAGLSLPTLDDKSPSLVHDVSEPELEEDAANDSQQISTSAKAMVSAAFRRMGTGTFNRSGTVSAPSTPRAAPRVEDYLKSAYRSNDKGPPQPGLLRSPGSAAYFNSVSRPSKPLLSPRFAEGKFPSRTNSSDSSARKHGASLVSPFRFARGCFSFDNTVSDDSHVRQGQSDVRPKIPDSMSSSYGMQLEPRSRGLRNLMQSRSWDVGSTPLSPERSLEHNSEYVSAFRALPGGGRVLHANTNQYRVLEPMKTAHNLSPAITKTNSAMALLTPQRVEIEREDALDILSCLVERSAAFEKGSVADRKQLQQEVTENRNHAVGRSMLSATPESGQLCEPIPEDDKVSTFAEVGTRNDSVIQSPPKRRRNQEPSEDVLESGSLSTEMMASIKDLRNISSLHGGDKDHDHRMKILDQLLYSHIYATEMKRAANSASTWLRSIGRSEDSSIDETASMLSFPGDVPLVDATMSGAPETEQPTEGEAICSSSFEKKMDLRTLRAMLHSASLQAKEKAKEAERLDEELTKCRAEIGRLKSAANTDVSFMSQNRSILDNDEHSEVSGIGADMVESDRDTSRTPERNAARYGIKSGEGSTDVLTGSFDEGYSGIGKPKGEHTSPSKFNGVSSFSARESPVKLVPRDSKIAGTSDESTDEETAGLNVADIQNFTSDWEREPPLPPPPDHDLRSPIVSDLLNQWTMDPAMHHSLLSWVERIIQGAGVNTVPPLTISSLDQEVRDGLLMHVLPLVLRRSDIDLEVKTRSQRRTRFDIAVQAHPKVNSRLRLPVDISSISTPRASSSFRHASDYGERIATPDSDVGANSVSHSTVTAHVSNSTVRHHHAETLASTPQADRGLLSSESAANQRHGQPGLMTAFNNTFGGLLSRSKKMPHHQNQIGHHEDSEIHDQPISWNHSKLPVREDEEDETQPYQRVLSCPPGRIGVTFVQYRGHAMVSDVSPESPLSGWVFQSDILIAIDEVPVSGMRVRDIVTLLTARKDRQRALRVISSHAMNEFTLNSSALSEAGM